MPRHDSIKGYTRVKTKNVKLSNVKENLEVSKILISTAKKLANSLRESKIILKNHDKIYSTNQAKLDKGKTLSDKDYKKESDMFNELCGLFDTQKELAVKLLTGCRLPTDTENQHIKFCNDLKDKPSISNIWSHDPLQNTTESSKNNDLVDYL